MKGLNQMCSEPGNVRAPSIDSIIGNASQKQAKSKSNSTRQQPQTTSLVRFIEAARRSKHKSIKALGQYSLRQIKTERKCANTAVNIASDSAG